VLNYFKKEGLRGEAGYISHGNNQSTFVEHTGIMTSSGKPGCFMEICITQMNQFKEVCK
jgi:hypothetical protein